MAEPIEKTFVIRNGVLVRTVVPRRGKPYVHRCELQSFRDVARWIEEQRNRGLTTGELWGALPHFSRTQASVALDFLKERGVVVVEGRRCYRASAAAFEDAMCEWHALEHEANR